MTELALGTVQLGMNYGATNHRGQVTADQALSILAAFERDGGRWLDTAPAYGNSERLLRQTSKAFAVVDKTVHLDANDSLDEGLRKLDQGFASSLDHLGRDAVDTLLCHQAWLLDGPWRPAVLNWLAQLKSAVYVTQVGVSIYQADELDESLLDHLDWVQFPLSVLDQRLIDSGWLSRLQQAGITTQARSLYLQGVLLEPEAAAIDIPADAKAAIAAFHRVAQQQSLMPEALALAFGRSHGIDQLVVGVNSLDEYRRLAAAWQQAEQVDTSSIDWRDFAVQTSSWLNPSNWKRR